MTPLPWQVTVASFNQATKAIVSCTSDIRLNFVSKIVALSSSVLLLRTLTREEILIIVPNYQVVRVEIYNSRNRQGYPSPTVMMTDSQCEEQHNVILYFTRSKSHQYDSFKEDQQGLLAKDYKKPWKHPFHPLPNQQHLPHPLSVQNFVVKRQLSLDLT